MADKPKFDPTKSFQVADNSAASAPEIAKPKFDPNQSFQAADDSSSWLDAKIPGGTPRGYIQGGLNALPSLGAMGGGALGFVGGEAAMPLGGGVVAGTAGAMGGGALGADLKSMGEEYLLGKKPQTREEFYQSLLDGAKTGAEQEAVAGLLKAGGESLARSGVQDVAKTFNQPGAAEVAAAATKLGVKPTQGMMTKDYLTTNGENSLAQSPSIPGSWVRKEIAPVHAAIAKTSEDALADATGRSPLEGGREMQKGVADTLEQRYKPIQDKYAEIEGHTKNIPLTEPKIAAGIKRVANNIRGLEEAKFDGSKAQNIANQFADWLEGSTNANDLKLLKTKARGLAEDVNSPFEERSVARSIMGKLDQVQQNSIMRQSVQIAREGAPAGSKILEGARDQAAVADGSDIGRGLIKDIKGTNKQYRGLMEDVQSFGKGSGLTKGKQGMSAALGDIRSANPQDMGSALFDAGNTEFTQLVKKQYPEQFEMARQQRLKEIAEKSQTPSGSVDPKKLLKIVNKMKAETPEALELLFGSKNIDALGAADTLTKSIPGKVGASDTPRGLAFQDVINPMQNVADLGRYGLLKAKPKFESIGNSVQGYARPGAAGLLQAGKAGRQGLVNIGLLNDR